MNLGKCLAVSAVMGILAGCGGPATDVKAPRIDMAGADAPSDKHVCGNHDGGACGAMNAPDTPETPQSPQSPTP